MKGLRMVFLFQERQLVDLLQVVLVSPTTSQHTIITTQPHTEVRTIKAIAYYYFGETAFILET